VKLLNYIKEVRMEGGRVVWPEKKEIWTSVLLVLVMVAIFGLFFLLVDTLMFKIVKFILG